MNNKQLLSVVAAGVMASATAHAGVSANIGVTSNYLWRGVTQSDDAPAVSGGVDFEHESGFFAGTWASSIDLGTPQEGTVYDQNGVEIGTVETGTDDGSYELDVYFGYAGEVGDFGYSATYNYYAYPELDDSDFSEILIDGSWQMLSAGFAYTVDGDAEEPARWVEGDIYYWASASFALSEDWSLGLTYGYYDFDHDGEDLDGDGIGDDISYGHYQADLSKSAGDMGDFTFTVSEADEESGDDETKVIVSWSKSF